MEKLFQSVEKFGKDYTDNLYEVLGCTTDSTTEQIHAEYKARARLFHPDRHEIQTSNTNTDSKGL
ncbi:hypothetical protein BB559_005063 [Furculomyces boomerangus]|uniref:J domain-containing protein n=1 Tax=Furculomyces boomerangus TaxID=61424 RepID=A0A2T9YB97_9FUNG|nr:hypothetical protein BB559_005063 [Furculomyces boomerangus]